MARKEVPGCRARAGKQGKDLTDHAMTLTAVCVSVPLWMPINAAPGLRRRFIASDSLAGVCERELGSGQKGGMRRTPP